MAYVVTSSQMTPDEYLDWEDQQPEKHEYIRGEIFAMEGVTRQHATIAGNVFAFLKQHLSGTPCRVCMAVMKVKQEAAEAFFYPDVFLTCSINDHQAERYLSEPRLIVEVLSASTEGYDRGEKFEHYRQFPSLAEYALIDPVSCRTEIFRKNATEHWVLYEYGKDDAAEFASLELTIKPAVLCENL